MSTTNIPRIPDCDWCQTRVTPESTPFTDDGKIYHFTGRPSVLTLCSSDAAMFESRKAERSYFNQNFDSDFQQRLKTSLVHHQARDILAPEETLWRELGKDLLSSYSAAFLSDKSLAYGTMEEFLKMVKGHQEDGDCALAISKAIPSKVTGCK